jgi:chromosome segregation ATPase
MGFLSTLGLVKEEKPKGKSAKIMAEAVAPLKEPTAGSPRRSGGRRRAPEPKPEAVTYVKMDKSIEKKLDKAVAATASDGFDFTNFAKMLEKNNNLEEGTQYQTALSAADAMGVAPEELISSAKKAITAVNTEGKKIELELSNLESDNRDNQNELERVNKQIASLQTRKASLEKKISTTATSIEDGKTNLQNTVGVITDEIRHVISNIKSYSKN